MCETNRIPVGDRVTIYPRGKKNIYVADFWYGNMHKRISLKTANKKIATERAKKLEAELVCGVFQTTIKEISFSDAVEGCLTGLQVNDRSRRTIVQFRGKMRLFGEFLSRRGIKTLGQITGLHLDQFRSERKLVKKSDRSVFNDAAAVLRLLRWAFNHGLIRENPLARYRLKKPRFSPKPAPSIAQIEAIFAAVEPPLRVCLVMLAFTGMRVGELQRLRPEDVDLVGNWIHIVSRPGLETKTRQSRKVPIHPRLRKELEAIPKNSRNWFFTARASKKFPLGGNWINPKKVNDQLAKILILLGMPCGRETGFVVHSFRRFFETFTVNSRIPQKVIDNWLGHSSDKSMGAVYYSLRDEDSQNFMLDVPFGTGVPAASAGEETRS